MTIPPIRARWWTSGVVAVGLVCVMGSKEPARAQPDEAHLLAKELMSPFCPGLTLADCPSPNAAVLRSEIETRLDAGESKAAVEADLVERFGTTIRGTPPPEGFAMLLWVGLPLVAIAGLGAVALTVARSTARARQKAPDAGGVAAPSSQELRDRLDDELAELD